MIISIIKYILLVPIDLLMSPIGRLLNPIAILFASKDGWLPKWLWAFQTPDNSLDGDEGFKREHRWFRNDLNFLKIYLNRVQWLNRNSMYGFDFMVMGANIEPGFTYRCIGDESVGNRPLHEGLVIRIVRNPSGSVYWQWYYVKAWSKTKCLRINLGWKLWGELRSGQHKQFTFNVWPFMGYRK